MSGDARKGIEVLEALVLETLELVELHMPEVNTSALRYRPRARQRPWRVVDLNE